VLSPGGISNIAQIIQTVVRQLKLEHSNFLSIPITLVVDVCRCSCSMRGSVVRGGRQRCPEE